MALHSGVPGAYGADPPRGVAVMPRLRDGETIADAIVRLRGEIGRIRAELARVRAAPLPADEIKAQLAAEVDRMAREGRPRLSVEGTRVRLHFPDVQEFSVPGQGALVAPSGGASKFLAWLFHDAMIARLTARLEDAPGTIPSADRPGRIRDLEEKLFTLEVEEEHWVAQAIAAGFDAHRRPDASPWAILGWGLSPAPSPSLAEAAE